jgi:hypothetical protein
MGTPHGRHEDNYTDSTELSIDRHLRVGYPDAYMQHDGSEKWLLDIVLKNAK